MMMMAPLSQQSMGFTSALSRVQDSGHHVGICTGTGAWNNLSGSPDAMLASQVAAHRAMAGMGAPGAGVSIVAHFSSDPALAHSVFAWPGIVAAAGLAWNPDFDLVSVVAAASLHLLYVQQTTVLLLPNVRRSI